MKKGFFFNGIILLLTAEFLKVYLIMPFPGSQLTDKTQFAYFLHVNIWWIRCLGIGLIAPYLPEIFRKKSWLVKICWLIPVFIYLLVFYFTHFKLLADKMFLVMETKEMLPVSSSKVSTDKLAVCIDYKGNQRAYPIEIIGYHHQVFDTVSGDPLFITYCTVCRTGRIYKPVINGKQEKFRLVGMDQFNAMFEDETTKSWWRQATGEAITGSMKGQALPQVLFSQMTLKEWINKYPATLILQPDPKFQNRYDHLNGFDDGSIKGGLEHRDSSSWEKKSWVVGITLPNRSVAVDWNLLQNKKIISENDFILILLGDNNGFYAFSTLVDNQFQEFEYDRQNATLTDKSTNSTWNLEGICVDGIKEGKELKRLPASQEFWHSWKSFQPATSRH